MMRCDSCGCDSVRQKSIQDLVFGECRLCGQRHADLSVLDRIEELEWAAENGIDDAILPLVLALMKIKGLHYMESSGGDEDLGMLPSVYFQLAPESYKYLDKLMQLIEAHTSKSGMKWIIDVSTRSGISFWIRPFVPVTTRKPTSREIKGARQDVGPLADIICQNIKLKWWDA